MGGEKTVWLSFLLPALQGELRQNQVFIVEERERMLGPGFYVIVKAGIFVCFFKTKQLVFF